MSAASIKEEIRSLSGIVSEQERALRTEKDAHERKQLQKFIADNERRISGLRLELRSTYGE